MYDVFVMSKNSIWGTNEVVPLVNIVLNVVLRTWRGRRFWLRISPDPDFRTTHLLLILFL